MIKWEYFTLKNGVLVDESGDAVLDAGVRFSSTLEAESYLEENDIRGNVLSEVWGSYPSTSQR